jgi:hypothetical protein
MWQVPWKRVLERSFFRAKINSDYDDFVAPAALDMGNGDIRGNLLVFGSGLKSLHFAAITLRASTHGQAGSQWRPLPLQMRRA